MSRQEKLAALASTGITKAELDNIDGGTARGTTAIADGDGVLINDAGTMRMTSVETMATYIGTKITGGSLVFTASTGALSGAASVQFRAQDGHFDATKFDHYIFKFMYVIPVNDNVAMQGFVSTDNGSSYDTTNGNYHYAGNTDTDGYFITPSYYVGSDTNEYGMCGDFTLFGPHLTNYTYAYTGGMVQTNDGSIRYQETSLIHLVAADVDAIKFQFSSGNIESGEIVMYGIANGT